MFTVNNVNHNYDTRNATNPRINTHRNTKYHNSFLCKGPSIYGVIPLSTRDSKKYKQIQRELYTTSGK